MPGIPTPRPQTEDDDVHQTPPTIQIPTREGNERTTQEGQLQQHRHQQNGHKDPRDMQNLQEVLKDPAQASGESASNEQLRRRTHDGHQGSEGWALPLQQVSS